MTGAKQHRVRCPHRADRPSEYAMASEVSSNNVWAFPSDQEHRVHSSLNEADVRELLDEARQTDRSLVACNQCRALLFVGGEDGIEVASQGEPRFDGAPVAGEFVEGDVDE
jgi:hypothetical protein